MSDNNRHPDEMMEEYDFSTGVRGKHYKQFAQGGNEVNGVGDADARNVWERIAGAWQGEELVREPQK